MNMNKNTKQTYPGKVALYHGPDKAVELLPMNWPAPQESQALVRITHCAICRSDVHTMCGRRHVQTPSVLGHEIIGHLVAVGTSFSNTDFSGQTLKLGDRVTWAIYAHCGECAFCRDGYLRNVFSYSNMATKPSQTLGRVLAVVWQVISC